MIKLKKLSKNYNLIKDPKDMVAGLMTRDLIQEKNN